MGRPKQGCCEAKLQRSHYITASRPDTTAHLARMPLGRQKHWSDAASPFPSPRRILPTPSPLSPYPHHSLLSSQLTHSNHLALPPSPAASPPASMTRQPHSFAHRPPHRSPALTDLGAACCVLRDRAGRTGRDSWSTCGWSIRSRSGRIRSGAPLQRCLRWIRSEASRSATPQLWYATPHT